jgi:hypothetical protein
MRYGTRHIGPGSLIKYAPVIGMRIKNIRLKMPDSRVAELMVIEALTLQACDVWNC